jgi:hypothetical protein
VLQLISDRTSASVAERDDTTPQLYFQRCRWCGTAMYQRLLCTGCGSTDLEAERSAGEGVLCVHRNVTAGADHWPVRMAEGFVVRCRVLGTRDAVRPGVRVRLAGGPASGAEPVVEPCDTPEPPPWTY